MISLGETWTFINWVNHMLFSLQSQNKREQMLVQKPLNSFLFARTQIKHMLWKETILKIWKFGSKQCNKKNRNLFNQEASHNEQ